MENESMECPKCGAIAMKRVGDYWVCANQYCNYRREVVKPIPTQADLLKENKELKERNIALEDIIEKLVKELHPKPRHTAQD